MGNVETKAMADNAATTPCEPIEIRGAYFLGQEDRDPDTGAFGINDYLCLPDGVRPIKLHDAQTRKVIDPTTDQVYVLLSEPDMDMFRECRLIPWREIYAPRYRGDPDYTDYAPAAYSSFTAFVNQDLKIYDIDKDE